MAWEMNLQLQLKQGKLGIPCYDERDKEDSLIEGLL
jgi:hypothetical protein